jgi:hypothetical protein
MVVTGLVKRCTKMSSDANSLLVLGEVDSLEQILLWVIAVIAVPIIIALCKRWYDSIIANRDRRRTLYSEAYATCLEYREYPFVIYRRNHMEPEAERTRISSSLTAIQKTMAFHKAWLRAESKVIADAYDQLYSAVRRVAGGEMKKSWNRKPIESDGEMIVGPTIDMSELDPYQEVYMQRVRYALRPFFVRCFLKKPKLVDDREQEPKPLKSDAKPKELDVNIGLDDHDGNRLLIATFIVASTIAFFQLNVPTSLINNAVGAGVIVALGFGLLSSSLFAFSYIMSKGYALRYRNNLSRIGFVDRYGHHMYNVAIFIFLPVIAIVAAIYTVAIVKSTGALDDTQLNILMWSIAIPLIILFNLGQIADIVSSLKERKLQN